MQGFLLFLSFLFVSVGLVGQNSPIDRAWEGYTTNPRTNKLILQKELSKARNEKNERNEAKCLSYLGVIADIEGNSKEAITLFHKAIRIQEKNKFQRDLSFSYNNLGIAHFYQNNYDIALTYYKKSYAIDKSLKDKLGAVGTLVNIGLIYTYQQKNDEAERNYNEALFIYQELGDSSGMSSVFNNLAKIKFEQKAFAECIALYTKAAKVLPSRPGIEVEFTTYFGLANTYLQLKDYQKAIAYAEISIEKASRVNARERLQYGYELLAQAYAQLGNHEKAFYFLTKYTNLRDSIVNESNSKAIAEMNARYESKKKDNIILWKEKKALKQAQKLDRFRLNLILSVSIILVLIIGLVFFISRSKSAKQQSVLLHERNAAISYNLKQKELMIGEIHHRVKNNLQLISSIIDLHARTLQEGKERAVLLDSKKRVESIALVHQKLYQNDEIYSVKPGEYFDDLGKSILQNFHHTAKTVTLQVSCTHQDAIHLDSAIPLGLIVSELITNSLKYAFDRIEQPRIDIRLDRQHNALILHYFDNGDGFSEEQWQNSNSFGKKMIHSLLRQLKAEASFKNSNGFHAAFHCINIIWK